MVRKKPRIFGTGGLTMADNTCISCGRIIPEGRHICLHCGDYDDQQRFTTPKPQIKTNADRIRSMTDDELIPIVHHYVCIQFPTGCPKERCDDCVRTWLKQEVER